MSKITNGFLFKFKNWKPNWPLTSMLIILKHILWACMYIFKQTKTISLLILTRYVYKLYTVQNVLID